MEDSEAALPHGSDGGGEQACAAVTNLTCPMFVVTIVLMGFVGFFSPPLPVASFIQGCYLAKIKCLSIIAFVCVNYSCGSRFKYSVSLSFFMLF